MVNGLKVKFAMALQSNFLKHFKIAKNCLKFQLYFPLHDDDM